MLLQMRCLPGEFSMGLHRGHPPTMSRMAHKTILMPTCLGGLQPKPPQFQYSRQSELQSRKQCNHLGTQIVFSSSKGSSSVEDSTPATSMGGNGSDPPPIIPGNGSGGNENQDDGDNEDSYELLNLAEAEAIAAKNGIELPADFVAAAQDSGLRLNSLQKLIDLRGVFMVGFLMHSVPWVRDRLIADSRFLFKILAEVSIDSGCCTIAEVRKRGHDFWGEFEFYLSDMVVGIVLDVALVSLLAPVAVSGKYPKYLQQSGIKKWLGQLPSAVFEASVPGVREFSIMDRVICYFVKGIEYGCVGFACGLVGQGFANGCMMLRCAPNLSGSLCMAKCALRSVSNSRFLQHSSCTCICRLWPSEAFPPLDTTLWSLWNAWEDASMLGLPRLFTALCGLPRRAGSPVCDDDVPIPPLLKSALVWGLFMGVSSNTRYQIVVGLERLVDLTLAKNIPQVAYATTIIIRFLNNVIGGENFIDMARWAGVQ